MAEENIGLPSEHMIEGVELLMRKHKRGDDRYRCAKMFGFTDYSHFTHSPYPVPH